eukprot:654181-Prorocentrum_minimum.AAC.1
MSTPLDRCRRPHQLTAALVAVHACAHAEIAKRDDARVFIIGAISTGEAPAPKRRTDGTTTTQNHQISGQSSGTVLEHDNMGAGTLGLIGRLIGHTLTISDW